MRVAGRNGAKALRQPDAVERVNAGVAVLELAVVGGQTRCQCVIAVTQDGAGRLEIVIVDFVSATRVDVPGVAIVIEAACRNARREATAA